MKVGFVARTRILEVPLYNTVKESTTYHSWSSEAVVEHLMSKLPARFHDDIKKVGSHEIAGAFLPGITAMDLKQMGIEKVGIQKAILQEIANVVH